MLLQVLSVLMPIVVKKLVLANNLPRNPEERMQLHIVCMYLPSTFKKK